MLDNTRFFTSYFYKIRFFTNNMIPFSTAAWDPKWFHNFSNQSTTFIDKQGVINGLRIPMFISKKCNGL